MRGRLPSGHPGAPRAGLCDCARGRRGATITEVVIAATLLSYVVLGSLAAISSAMKYANHARMVTLASQVVQSAMEGLRLKNYAEITALAAQTQPVAITSTIGSELTSSTFTQTMSVQARFTTLVASGSAQLGLIGVEINVAWTEGSVPFTRSTRSYFAEKGLSDYIYVGF